MINLVLSWAQTWTCMLILYWKNLKISKKIFIEFSVEQSSVIAVLCKHKLFLHSKFYSLFSKTFSSKSWKLFCIHHSISRAKAIVANFKTRTCSIREKNGNALSADHLLLWLKVSLSDAVGLFNRHCLAIKIDH